jgi:predicted DNA-binding antitoxin AbrB/MazE fold protein
MNFSIDAIYENGVLKPINPLPLQEHSRVRVSLEMVPEQSRRRKELCRPSDGPRGCLGRRAMPNSFGELPKMTSSAFY